jgi:hypothetical protein
MTPKLPDHAQDFFKNWPWQQATWHPLQLAGLMFDGLAAFDGMLLWTTDLDVDTDGPGGSNAVDKYWQGETSLRWPDNSSLDSRQFPGIVVPPALLQFGVKKGDFGFIFWRGQTASFQVYDFGPHDKAGEGSVYLVRAIGGIPSTASDHKAATYGDEVKDAVSVIFPGTAPGTGEPIQNHAISTRLIHKTVERFLVQRGLSLT